ncbi:amidohydrolase family protein [Patescibacteria group bacterium]|nr:amidohydrolase family protein [Patescibacteria group bacterium]MCL5798085.1 amidohydrolase family protein [Patescibacteria group bacterium]
MDTAAKKFGELTELHVHIGSAVDPPIMWEIAQEQGIRLPTKNYWDFEKLITVSDDTNYKKYLDLFHWTELIQSSPEAMEKSIYSIASGAYRKNGITTLEIRFNPMLRNRGGERDLDHIILSSIHSMERAMLSYPMRIGLILMCDRRFSQKLNSIIAEKAVKYARRGVIGIDLAGPIDPQFSMETLVEPIKACKRVGLGVTIHTGEATGADEMMRTIKLLEPDRIGHGVRAVEDKNVLLELKNRNIVLEVCPTSNLNTRVVKNLSDFKNIFAILKEQGVAFTVNTDGPEMLRTNLLNEYQTLLDNNILSLEDLNKASQKAKEASFIRSKSV